MNKNGKWKWDKIEYWKLGKTENGTKLKVENWVKLKRGQNSRKMGKIDSWQNWKMDKIRQF